MKTDRIKRIITPILTPMNADESINTDELRTQMTDLSMAVCTEFSHLEQTVRDIS